MIVDCAFNYTTLHLHMAIWLDIVVWQILFQHLKTICLDNNKEQTWWHRVVRRNCRFSFLRSSFRLGPKIGRPTTWAFCRVQESEEKIENKFNNNLAFFFFHAKKLKSLKKHPFLTWILKLGLVDCFYLNFESNKKTWIKKTWILKLVPENEDFLLESWNSG